MITGALLEHWKSAPRLFELADRLSLDQPQTTYLKNLRGSASQFVAAAAFLHPSLSHLNHLFVCNDSEEAAYFHNTLENLTNAINLFYFPSSFKNRKNYQLLNPSHVMLRTETLTRFAAGGGNRVGALITYPDALFEKVVVPKAITENMISFKTGDVLDVDGLFKKLVDFGFERTDFVFEPGQFAVRGGILDIYSFGNEKPYRIELFGNDVDSIRIFDPETQLSERKLMQVSIIPNVDTQFDSGEKVSLLEFLPENTVVWIQDWQFAKERILTQEEDLDFFLELQKETQGKKQTVEEEDDKVLKDVKQADFVRSDVLERQLLSRHIIEFDRGNYFKGLEITFNTKEQPSFNRQ